MHTLFKHILVLVLMLLSVQGVNAQRCYDASGRLFGRVTDNHYVYDPSGRLQMRFDSDRIYDASGRLLGRTDRGTIYDSSGRVMLRTRDNLVYDASGRLLGRIGNHYVYDASGRLLGRYEGSISKYIIIVLYILAE